MHIAVFENRFGEYACALRQRQHRHELRLHVSGKGGEGRSGKGKWPQWPIGADLDTIRPFLDRHARFTQTRSEEHTSELQSLMRISYAVFCLKKKTKTINTPI